ncbi:MAG: hypothetical protein IT385_13210 [Deltaproteobacteria bacterium]|nr:hypothetical protein [Deltaproteobacteria bacterium]
MVIRSRLFAMLVLPFLGAPAAAAPTLDATMDLALPDEDEIARLVMAGGTLRVVVDGELVEVDIAAPARGER